MTEHEPPIESTDTYMLLRIWEFVPWYSYGNLREVNRRWQAVYRHPNHINAMTRRFVQPKGPVMGIGTAGMWYEMPDGRKHGQQMTLKRKTNALLYTTTWNRGFMHGLEVYYWSPGVRRSLTSWHRGRKHGPAVSWLANGAVHEASYYHQNELKFKAKFDAWNGVGIPLRTRPVTGFLCTDADYQVGEADCLQDHILKYISSVL